MKESIVAWKVMPFDVFTDHTHIFNLTDQILNETEESSIASL